MSETTMREAVLAEYRIDRTAPVVPGVMRVIAGHDGLAMADEIVRLRAILAALREPSEAIVDAVTDLGDSFEYLSRLDVYTAVRAAVAAAEKEVGRE